MDFQQLVHPLSASHSPCGEDMIFSPEFDEIQQARRFDDPSLSQGEWVTEIKEADWEKVIRVCEDVLANKSKDLRIAAWLTEARGKTGGLAGLAEGYALLGFLCDAFWDDIHPQPEDGDLEQRVGVLDWLVNQTSRLIREVPLTNSAKGRFSTIDQESARATAKNIERNPGMADELGRNASVTQESFEAALKDTPKPHFVDGMRDAERLKDAMKSLQMVLDLRMGPQAPAFSATFDVLEDVFRFFRRHGGDSAAAVLDVADTGMNGVTPSASAVRNETSGSAANLPTGPVQSREQAIRQLQEIAAFFRRTEPHSPVAYLADKAAKWGAMSLHEWLRAVVKDGTSLSNMEELLGVDAQPPEGQG
jgi:type VI secretion system protein ImpA